MATDSTQPASAPSLEPPYGDILLLLREGRVIPFLGAGASIGPRSSAAEPWSPKSTDLPTGRDLAGYLANMSNFPGAEPQDRDDLARVASYSADISGRSTLRRHLRRALNRHFDSRRLHTFLAQVPAHLLCVVTNYDTLLEQAFRETGKRFDVVIYPADRRDNLNSLLYVEGGVGPPKYVEANSLDLDLDDRSIIYKMHGTIWPEDETLDNFVITEEDYVEFLSRMTTNASSAVPAQFYQYSRSRSFLFLGYSLRDWNLRVVLKNLRRQLTSENGVVLDEDLAPSWAIQRYPSALEQRLWSRRRVEIFDMDLDRFVEQLVEWGPRV
ncbi:MAG: SIR2 family protein [Vicinamibacterales bacterium]